MKKFLTILTAALLVLVSAFAVGCNVQEQEVVKPSDGVIHVHNVRMAMGAPMTATGNDGTQYIEKTLSATVLPLNAYNRKVDFFVEWGEGASRSSEPVSDYLTVVPTSDGSATAKVRCYKSFGDDKIIIVVKTRDVGLTDYCTVSFVGFCSDLKFDTSALMKSDLETVAHAGEYILIANSTYTIPVIASNIFDDTTTKLKVTAYGWTGCITTGFMTNPMRIELDERDGYKKLFSANIDDNNLVITINKYSLTAGSVICLDENDVYETDGILVRGVDETIPTYLYVIIEDEFTSTSQEFRFWIEASPESVELDNKVMEFSVNENN